MKNTAYGNFIGFFFIFMENCWDDSMGKLHADNAFKVDVSYRKNLLKNLSLNATW